MNIRDQTQAIAVLITKLVFMPFQFLESRASILTNPALDPIAKIPEYKVWAVRIEKLG